MKHILAGFISLVLLCSMNPVSAAETAQLRMKISGPITNNRYFLCVSHVGCTSILNGNKGKVFPMDAGDIANISTVDMGTKRIHIQNVPASCNATVNANQTVTITGKLVNGPKNKVVIQNLRCSIA